MSLSERRARLARARLYLICDATPGGRPLADVLPAALRGGVDVFQLRCKDATDAEILAAAALARQACTAAGALFILNDRPDLVGATGADGAHVGQDDDSVARARELAGPDALIGQSTHSPQQIAAADGADYLGVGPVHTTPTKPGRPAVGLDLVAHAAANATVPFFAIGGIDQTTVEAAMTAGAQRVAVVRAIAEDPDPEAAARHLADALDQGPAGAPAARHLADALDQGPAGAPAARHLADALDHGPAGARQPRKSSDERNQEIRAGLEPIAPGERPLPLVIATAAAILLGVVNLVLAAAGGHSAGGAGTLAVYCALMFAAAWGMWTKRYMAVLLFQILLAILVIFFFLFLLRASSVTDVALSLAVIVPCGWLFWKLVRVLARLQTPRAPVAHDR